MPCPETGCKGRLRRKASKHGLFYGCNQWGATGCPGSIGCHPDGKPLGVPASSTVKNLRIQAHAAFDPIWKDGMMRRGQAYRWLSNKMGKQIHIGELTADECKEVIRLSLEFYPELYPDD